MWADTSSYMILLKTTDKSLHLIHNKTKLWTKSFGLSSISKALSHDDKLIALTKHSKVFGLDAKTGAITWERSAIGRIADIYTMGRKEGTNVALVIDSLDAKKTRIAEVTLKGGEKTEYLQAYPDFVREESVSLQSFTDIKSNVALLTSFDHRFDVYPDNTESLKEVSDHKKLINFYRLNRQMSVLSALRVTSNMTAIEEAWNITFEKTSETVMAFKESRAENGLRDAEVLISGKEFKRFEGVRALVAILTLARETQAIKLHLVDSQTGTVIISKQISDKLPAKVPLLVVYDNAVLVGLHYGKDKADELILTELFIAPEMAGTENKADIQKVSLAELVYPVVTNIAIDWKIYGLQMIKADGVEYITSIDEHNNVRMIETHKLTRGKQEMAVEGNTKTVKVPEGMKFRAPVSIEYNHEKKHMLVHGLDVYSFQFPQ